MLELGLPEHTCIYELEAAQMDIEFGDADGDVYEVAYQRVTRLYVDR
ncbi:hypothetical protein [Prauserella endophytica]|nr:hypothetical protein [Prauserella endophytica]